MEEILYNLKLTTDMKNQLLKDVSDIFEFSSKGNCKEELSQSIGSCMLALMLLSRRCGIEPEKLREQIMHRVNTGIAERHICETQFGDLTTIANFIRGD